ncbi:MAG: cytidylate kinase-like family protein [bacterium]
MHYLIDRLVNKAIERSQLERVEKLKIKTDWNPDIAISRDPGSGGKVIAKKLAKQLGWQLFNKALMLELSKELGMPTEQLSHVDEHSRSWATDFVHSILNPDYVSDIMYITHLKQILLHASKRGDMVILGRGANLVLPPDKCLRVRITASLKTRVENFYKYEKTKTKLEASNLVKHLGDQRNRFIKQYFGTNPHNPWNYDLVISTDHLTPDQAVEIILQAYKSKFPDDAARLKSKLS